MGAHPRRVWAAVAMFLAVAAGATALIASNEDAPPGKTFDSSPDAPRNLPVRIRCGSVDSNRSARGSWGPDRPTYTLAEPAPVATLNSIIDNPSYGDERPFFTVKSSSDDRSGGFCSSTRVADGDVLLFSIYAENSAADNLAGGRGTDRKSVV